MINKPDVLVVGAGIYGLTMAERFATQLNKKVLVIDKRNHIGGNAYSEFDDETGIECHKYGAHLFHTSSEKVWEYVNEFTAFTNYQHRVYTIHEGEVFPLPINLGTINQFFHAAYSPEEARRVIAEQAASAPENPKNLQEQGISLIGRPLFEAFIMNYTAKQWQTPAEELSPKIITRLPVRYNYNNRYFSNSFEGLPIDGYEAWFQSMIDSCGNKIEVRLETNYFEDKDILELKKEKILTIFTGPIDQFFNYKFGELKWRTLEFQKEIVETNDFQGCPVMNYADLNVPYTRIHEFKHFHPERTNDGYDPDFNKTIIVKEYSKHWRQGDEPYYPVNTPSNQKKLEQYQSEAKKHKNIVFGGRLGEYAYYDMDMTFLKALEKFEEIKDNLETKK